MDPMRKRLNDIYDRRIKKLEIYSHLFQHWDNSFWSATYVFLALQGALLYAFVQIYSNKFSIYAEILILLSFCASLISWLWLYVMNRKMSYTPYCI